MPDWAVYNFGYAYFMVGDYADALAMLDRFPKESYTPATYVYRAAALAALGRVDEAKDALAQALAHNPGISVESFSGRYASNEAERQRLVRPCERPGFRSVPRSAIRRPIPISAPAGMHSLLSAASHAGTLADRQVARALVIAASVLARGGLLMVPLRRHVVVAAGPAGVRRLGLRIGRGQRRWARADERLEVVMPDGVRLVGGLRRARGPSRGLLLVFGGNAEDNTWRLRHFDGWLDDVHIATFYYRGYGPSGGTPNQTALVADAACHPRPSRGLCCSRRIVVAAGFSLGSGVVAQLARSRPLAGAILVTPFDSILAVAAERYPFAPVRWLLRHPFRSDEALAGVEMPVAVIAAAADRVVSPERTRQLLAVLARPLAVAWIEGANHVSIYDRPEYRAAFREALACMLGPGR